MLPSVSHSMKSFPNLFLTDNNPCIYLYMCFTFLFLFGNTSYSITLTRSRTHLSYAFKPINQSIARNTYQSASIRKMADRHVAASTDHSTSTNQWKNSRTSTKRRRKRKRFTRYLRTMTSKRIRTISSSARRHPTTRICNDHAKRKRFALCFRFKILPLSTYALTLLVFAS